MPTGRATHLELPSSQLRGSIPAELGLLANLEELILSSNDLSGTIPSSLGQLTNLEWLYLDGNDLSGSIPSALGQPDQPGKSCSIQQRFKWFDTFRIRPNG